MTKTNRALSLVMAVILMLTSLASASLLSANAASNPVFTVNAVTGITPKDATISAKITNPNKQKFQRIGFQMGTSKNDWTINKYDTVESKYYYYSYLTGKFTMSDSDYGVTLKPNTTYYYRFYAKIGGNYYYSSIDSFKTKKAPAFTINDVSGISLTDATVSAKITNPNNTKIDRVGFQIGLASNKLTTTKYDSVSMTDSAVTASFKMSKYKVTLKENTTYYYRFFIKTGGEYFYSSVKTFKTLSKEPTLATPTATSVTHNNAIIGVKVTNPYKLTVTKAGYQIGTSETNLSINKSKNINSASTSQSIKFGLSNYKVTLKPNTTYYYKTYVIVGNKTYYSSVQSFKTLPETPTFTYKSVSNLTYNCASLSFTLNNPAEYNVTKAGYQLGTSKDNLSIKKAKAISNDTSTVQNIGFNLSNYKVTLKENTTYYYRVFVLANDKYYYGAIKSFTTPPKVKYPAIESLKISRIVQPAKDTEGSCYLSSIATVYGYKTGTYSNVDYRVGGKDISQDSSALYKAFYKKNGGTTYVDDSTISYYGLKKSSFSLEKAYEALKAGKPVAIHSKLSDNVQHASVIIGYKGNSSTLKASDFIVMEIKDGYYYDDTGLYYDKGYWDNTTSYYNTYANKPASTGYFQTKSCYVTLDKWISCTGVMPQNMVTY